VPHVPLASWTPDQAEMQTGMVKPINAIRTKTGWRPMPSLKQLSVTGIPAPANALFLTSDLQGNEIVYAVGANSKIWRYDVGPQTFFDVSRATPAYAANRNWTGTRWANKFIVANGADKLQVIDVTAGTGAKFADLSATAPNAQFVTVVRDQVMVANIGLATDTGTAMPNRVAWSAIDDATLWTPNMATLCDFQDVPDLGACRGLCGGNYGVALFELGIVRITFVGPPLIYQFDRVEFAVGCLTARSVAQLDGSVFYLSESGFQQFDGQRSLPIGKEKIDRAFFDDVKIESVDKMSAAVDPAQRLVFWTYPGARSVNGKPNKILIYDPLLQEWSFGVIENDCLGVAAQPGYTLDQLDRFGTVDTLVASMDDRMWRGSTRFLAAMVNGQLNNFTGPPLDAQMDSTMFAVSQMRRAMLQSIYPVVEGDNASIQVQVWTKGRGEIAWSSGPMLNENSTGWFGTRAEGRYHRIRLVITGYWKHATGFEYMAQPMGYR
jgi:hypothetical protein